MYVQNKETVSEGMSPLCTKYGNSDVVLWQYTVMRQTINTVRKHALKQSKQAQAFPMQP